MTAAKATTYTRDALRQIGGEFILFLGFDLKDPDKPVKALKSYTDEQLEAHIVDEMIKARDAGYLKKDGTPADLTAATDTVLAFMMDKGVVVEPSDDAMLEEDDGEEDLGAQTDVPAVQEEDELAALEKELAELESGVGTEAPAASKQPAPPVEAKPVQEPEPAVTPEPPAAPVAETPAAPVQVDPKVETLAAMQDTTPEKELGKYAAVTLNNVEAAVLAIAKILGQGKVVVISAHEVGAVPVVGHTTPSIPLPVVPDVPTAPAPVSTNAPASDVPPAEVGADVRAAFIKAAVDSYKSQMRKRLTKSGDLGTIAARRAFITQNGVTFKRTNITADNATEKQCAIALLAWAAKAAEDTAAAEYDAEASV